ncbi:hypothetical protein CPC08DRAFT_768952 [Agrocybe pediades]|nr:hypothetical protein CPC08DRAFT_768952 [Agrocybe pediades]
MKTPAGTGITRNEHDNKMKHVQKSNKRTLLRAKHASLPELSLLSSTPKASKPFKHLRAQLSVAPMHCVCAGPKSHGASGVCRFCSISSDLDAKDAPSPFARISHEAVITRRMRRSSTPGTLPHVYLNFRVDVDADASEVQQNHGKHTETHDASFARSASTLTVTGPTPNISSSRASALSASGNVPEKTAGSAKIFTASNGRRLRLRFMRKPKSLDLLSSSLSTSTSASLGMGNDAVNARMFHGDRGLGPSRLIHSSTYTDLQLMYRDGDCGEKNGDGDAVCRGGDIVVKATDATKVLPSEDITSAISSVDRSTTTTPTPVMSAITTNSTPSTPTMTTISISRPSSAMTLRLKASASTLTSLSPKRTLRSARRVLKLDNNEAASQEDEPQQPVVDKGKGREIVVPYDEDSDNLGNTANDTNTSRLRTLRRRKHLNVNIVQTAVPSNGPIAISLELASNDADPASPEPSEASVAKESLPASAEDEFEQSAMMKQKEEPNTLSHQHEYTPSHGEASLAQIHTQTQTQLQSVHPPPVLEPHTRSYQIAPPSPTTPTTPTQTSHNHVAYNPTVPPSTCPSGLSSSQGPEASSPPKSPSPTASPVRLGHPSRPYYSAIRKNGVSAASAAAAAQSRHQHSSSLSSIKSVRPHSYQPPASPTAEGDVSQFKRQQGSMSASTSASRHQSMSAIFSPPSFQLSAMSMELVNSVDDDEDYIGSSSGRSAVDNLNRNSISRSSRRLLFPPSPAPGRVSFSFLPVIPSSTSDVSPHGSPEMTAINATATDTVRRLSSPTRGILLPSTPPAPLSTTTPSPELGYRLHVPTQSLSLGRASHVRRGRRPMGNFGFSMSGQTELRMALAALAAEEEEAAAAEGSDKTRHVGSGGEFKFRQTVPLPRTDDEEEEDYFRRSGGRAGSGLGLGAAAAGAGSRKDSFTFSLMGRVKKLRKGLKEMIGSHGSESHS